MIPGFQSAGCIITDRSVVLPMKQPTLIDGSYPLKREELRTGCCREPFPVVEFLGIISLPALWAAYRSLYWRNNQLISVHMLEEDNSSAVYSVDMDITFLLIAQKHERAMVK